MADLEIVGLGPAGPELVTPATTDAIAPGGYEDVEIALSSQLAAQAPLVFIADDQGDQTMSLQTSRRRTAVIALVSST